MQKNKYSRSLRFDRGRGSTAPRVRFESRMSWRHVFENRQPRRDHSPCRAITGKDRNRRMECQRLVQRARINRETIRNIDFPAEYEAAAHSARVAHRITAACGLRSKLESLAAKPHRISREPHEGYEARAGCLSTIRAIAVTRAVRFPAGVSAQCAAKPTPGVTRHRRHPLVDRRARTLTPTV